MSHARNDSADSPVALFPFLAVLICTMGIMIILLVVASKASEVHQRDADSAAVDRYEEARDALEFERQTADLMSDVLSRGRGQLLERLTQARLRRSHIENELREFESRFQSIAAKVQRLRNPETAQPPDSADSVADLQNQLEVAQQQLDDARQRAESRPTTYSIVAHPSIHGTLRRPIYIECDAAGVTIQPSGIRIPADELRPPILPGNSLDCALLATREYWIKNKLAGAQGDPYPLLVVRPDGASTYGLARLAMRSWNDEFGYELIEQNAAIDYGPIDEDLTNVLRDTIATTQSQYKSLQQMALQSEKAANQGSGGPGGLVVSQNGGFELVGGEDLDSSLGRSSHSALQSSEKGQELSAEKSSTAPSDPTQQSPAVSQNAAGQNSSIGAIPNSAVVPLSQVRGSNWALASQNQGTVAYRRPIVVYCERDMLTIDDAQDPTRRTKIAWTNDAAAVDEFVQGVWKMIESWGIAERNGYWRPELRFVVMRGGHPLFERVQQLMADSGFDVREEVRR